MVYRLVSRWYTHCFIVVWSGAGVAGGIMSKVIFIHQGSHNFSILAEHQLFGGSFFRSWGLSSSHSTGLSRTPKRYPVL